MLKKMLNVILAESFGRIFYRNVINLGIPVLVCPGIGSMIKKGDIVTVDIRSGKITNETTGLIVQAQPMSDYVMDIIKRSCVETKSFSAAPL